MGILLMYFKKKKFNLVFLASPFLYLEVKIPNETMDQVCTYVERQYIVKYIVIKEKYK